MEVVEEDVGGSQFEFGTLWGIRVRSHFVCAAGGEDKTTDNWNRRLEVDLVYYPLAIAVGLTILRKLLDRTLFYPAGRLLGLRQQKRRQPLSNQVLEAAYSSKHKLSQKEITGLSKQVDWDVRKVERWLRIRRRQDRPSVLDKFAESGWKFTFYTLAFVFGFYILHNRHWFWNVDECWKGYPYQDVDISIHIYYLMELGFYWSQFASQFFDTKRKDFWQMFMHHIATIALLSVSWAFKYFRIGSIVACLHDSADIFLESTKMAHYSKFENTSAAAFAGFVLVWMFTRLYIYPFWVINSAIHQALICQSFAGFVAVGLLLVLQVLHIFWTYFILKVLPDVATHGGKAKGDARSSSDDVASEEDLEE